MCRMLAIKDFRYRRHRALLESFSLLAEKGRVPRGARPGHEDGWGIGYYKAGRAFLHKSASSILRDKDDFLGHIRNADGSPTLLVHVRKSAWADTSTAANAHPFLHDNLLFAHNGTIRDYKTLLPWVKVGGASAISRALDTEVFFYFILSRLKTGAPQIDIKGAMKDAINHIKRENSFSSLNCVLASSKALFAYRQYTIHPSYYSLYHARDGFSDLVCSEPLGSSLSWKMLRRGRFLVL